MRYDAKIDENQRRIVRALRMIGAYVLLTHRLKNAFDFLCFFNGQTFVFEVKNPERLPKHYDRERLIKELSDGEKECMGEMERRGVKYHIIATVDEALEVLGVADQIKNKLK